MTIWKKLLNIDEHVAVEGAQHCNLRLCVRVNNQIQKRLPKYNSEYVPMREIEYVPIREILGHVLA